MPASFEDYVGDAVAYLAGNDTISVDQERNVKVEETTSHQAAAAIDDMISAYGGIWPPRPTFSGWPASWRVFAQIADDMPRVCHEMNDVTKFREWMRNELKEKIDLPQVMRDIESRMRTDDAGFFAFLAPLTFMVNLYRWGTVPTTDEERLRRVLEFPEQLWKPFTKLSDFWGLVHRGGTFTLAVTNCMYENEADPDMPTGMRFRFNHLPEIVHSEMNFFKSFLHMENTFRPALLAMRDFLNQTEIARRSRADAERVLARRIELLGDVRKGIVGVSSVFYKYMKDTVVNSKEWAEHVQAVAAWNMNGVEGGSSGGETMTFHALDEFLGCDGKGIVYTGGKKKREGIPRQYVNVINALRDFGRDYRFCSFLGHDEKDDPVMVAKDDIIQMLYTWRLGHAKVAPRYLIPSRMTAGGGVDKVMMPGETLASRGEFELRERARETAVYLTTRPPPPSALHVVNLTKDSKDLKDSTMLKSNAMSSSYVSNAYEGLTGIVITALSKLKVW